MTKFENINELVVGAEEVDWSVGIRRDAYARAVTAINRQLERCVQWLDSSRQLVVESVAHSDACGNLVALAQRLEVLENILFEHGGHSDQLNSDHATVNSQSIALLNHAYVLCKRSQSKLDQYRHATIRRHSVGARLARLAVLCRDEDVLAWNLLLSKYVETAGSHLPEALARLGKENRTRELQMIEKSLRHVAEDSPELEKALSATRKARKAAEQQSDDTQRQNLLTELHGAHAMLDRYACQEHLDTLETFGGRDALNTDQCYLYDDVTNWLEQERALAETQSNFNQRLEELERALEENRSRAELERLHSPLLSFDEAIPAYIETRYRAQVRAVDRAERSRRRILAYAAIIAVALSATVTVWWIVSVQHTKSLNQAAEQVFVLIEKGDLDGAHEILLRLNNQRGSAEHIELNRANAEFTAAKKRRATVDEAVVKQLSEYESFPDSDGAVSIIELAQAIQALQNHEESYATPKLIDQATQLAAACEIRHEQLLSRQRSLNDSATAVLRQRITSAFLAAEILRTQTLANRVGNAETLNTEAEEILSESDAILTSDSLDPDIRSRLVDVRNRAQRLVGQLTKELADSSPALELLKSLASSKNEAHFEEHLRELVETHVAIIATRDVTTRDWQESLEAAEAASTILSWRELIAPILSSAPDGRVLFLSAQDFDDLGSRAASLLDQHPNGPLHEQLTALAEMQAPRDALDTRSPTTRFIEQIDSSGLRGLITATVLDKKSHRVLLGYGEVDEKAKEPFARWVKNKADLGQQLHTLATGASAVDDFEGIVIYKKRSTPWPVSLEIDRTFRTLNRDATINSQFVALDLIDRVTEMKDISVGAKFHVLLVLWRAYISSFDWPSEQNDALEAAMQGVLRVSARARTHDWVQALHTIEKVDHTADSQSGTAIRMLPKTAAVRSVLRNQLALIDDLKIGSVAGILQPGAGTSRAAKNIPDGIYLALSRTPNRVAWKLVEVLVQDGYAVAPPDGVPDGTVLLYSLQKEGGS